MSNFPKAIESFLEANGFGSIKDTSSDKVLEVLGYDAAKIEVFKIALDHFTETVKSSPSATTMINSLSHAMLPATECKIDDCKIHIGPTANAVQGGFPLRVKLCFVRECNNEVPEKALIFCEDHQNLPGSTLGFVKYGLKDSDGKITPCPTIPDSIKPVEPSAGLPPASCHPYCTFQYEGGRNCSKKLNGPYTRCEEHSQVGLRAGIEWDYTPTRCDFQYDNKTRCTADRAIPDHNCEAHWVNLCPDPKGCRGVSYGHSKAMFPSMPHCQNHTGTKPCCYLDESKIPCNKPTTHTFCVQHLIWQSGLTQLPVNSRDTTCTGPGFGELVTPTSTCTFRLASGESCINKSSIGELCDWHQPLTSKRTICFTGIPVKDCEDCKSSAHAMSAPLRRSACICRLPSGVLCTNESTSPTGFCDEHLSEVMTKCCKPTTTASTVTYTRRVACLSRLPSGDWCSNESSLGSKFCLEHQSTCKFSLPSGEICCNESLVNSSLCFEHQFVTIKCEGCKPTTPVDLNKTVVGPTPTCGDCAIAISKTVGPTGPTRCIISDAVGSTGPTHYTGPALGPIGSLNPIQNVCPEPCPPVPLELGAHVHRFQIASTDPAPQFPMSVKAALKMVYNAKDFIFDRVNQRIYSSAKAGGSHPAQLLKSMVELFRAPVGKVLAYAQSKVEHIDHEFVMLELPRVIMCPQNYFIICNGYYLLAIESPSMIFFSVSDATPHSVFSKIRGMTSGTWLGVDPINYPAIIVEAAKEAVKGSVQDYIQTMTLIYDKLKSYEKTIVSLTTQELYSRSTKASQAILTPWMQDKRIPIPPTLEGMPITLPSGLPTQLDTVAVVNPADWRSTLRSTIAEVMTDVDVCDRYLSYVQTWLQIGGGPVGIQALINSDHAIPLLKILSQAKSTVELIEALRDRRFPSPMAEIINKLYQAFVSQGSTESWVFPTDQAGQLTILKRGTTELLEIMRNPGMISGRAKCLEHFIDLWHSNLELVDAQVKRTLHQYVIDITMAVATQSNECPETMEFFRNPKVSEILTKTV